MNNEQKHRLSRMQVDLVKNLRDVEDIIDHLISLEVLSRTQSEQILLSGPTIPDKIRSLLSTLVRCGPNAYDAFIDALEKTNQSSLVDKLKNLAVDSSTFPTYASTGHVRNLQPKPVDSALNQYLTAYPVNSTPRGYILLVNVANFEPNCGLSNRIGSSEDVADLNSLFTDLGYFVEILLDPTSMKLESAISYFINSQVHYNVDAGGLIVMSHGVQDYIYTSDGKLFPINDILEAFTNKSFPAMAGKPKFILFQACRGEEKDRGYIFEPDAVALTSHPESVDYTVSVNKTNWKCLPSMSDYIIAYSTLPGFVSWRSERDGSWFIQILVEVFRKYASSLHVLDLLTEVNRRLVEESQDREFKQITQQQHTLTRPFYLSTVNFKS